MPATRVDVVESALDQLLDQLSAQSSATISPLAADAPLRPGGTLTAAQAVGIFEDQVLSRQIDIAARRLRARGNGFYTISSAGHEQNAIVGAQLELDDACFLHYRSGGFMMARARRLAPATPLFDTLLSLCASADDPISGGRHKVWGSVPLLVPPQTSTIASQIPKAVGMAFALGRARRLGLATGNDEIVCCSFGDASANHATALAGINAARYAHRRGNSVPILFLCEDNGIGISVDTPRRWITDAFSGLRHLRYFEADGEIDEVWETTRLAIESCRRERRAVFLHLRTVRLWGHAGSDVETQYRAPSDIEAVEARDPLLRNARTLVQRGATTAAALQALVRATRARVLAAEQEVESRPRLTTREQIIAPLAPRSTTESTPRIPDAAAREAVWGDRLPEHATAPTKRTLGAHINAALVDAMIDDPRVIVFGEDVGKKGGVYSITAGLQKKFGLARVFDTLLDETTILGVAQGAAQVGLMPIPEIQYLAYLHNAIDQLRGEASSLSFFSNTQYRNPMVVRIASFAYQKGFGGHFHNDNSIGALREILGLFIAVPARGDDAAALLRGCLALARESGSVVAFLEPIALYPQKDLYEDGDGGWLTDYPTPETILLPGDTRTYGEGKLLIITYGNGVRMSLRATQGLAARVLDMRWLAPLPWESIQREAESADTVLVVDECRATGAGIADAVIARLAESGYRGTLRSVRAADSFIPIGPAADAVLVSEAEITAAAREALA